MDSGGSSQVEAPSGKTFGALKLKLQIEVARKLINLLTKKKTNEKLHTVSH